MADDFRDERPSLAIIGVRGVPAAHGGFETFAARLAPFLQRSRWRVTVYCQESDPPDEESRGRSVWESEWEGVRRVHIAVPADTAFNSIRFDWRCIGHVIGSRPNAVLMLGYNTAVFAARLRKAGIATVINMDGMEWRREKWSFLEKAWLYLNERAGCLLAKHLIADHPQIGRHLQTRSRADKISVIPYGSDLIERRFEVSTSEQYALLERVGVISRRFATVIARPEPENSILEIVRAFSSKPRGVQLVVLGRYYPDRVGYHADVLAAAGTEVVFPGALYDTFTVEALRRHSLFYLHGHRVGGCNPSLLEAMGAGNPVIAHDNPFNRWVVGDGAGYFSSVEDCSRLIGEFLGDPVRLEQRAEANRRRAAAVFDWSDVLHSYDKLLGVVSGVAGRAGSADRGLQTAWRLDAPS